MNLTEKCYVGTAAPTLARGAHIIKSRISTSTATWELRT